MIWRVPRMRNSQRSSATYDHWKQLRVRERNQNDATPPAMPLDFAPGKPALLKAALLDATTEGGWSSRRRAGRWVCALKSLRPDGDRNGCGLRRAASTDKHPGY